MVSALISVHPGEDPEAVRHEAPLPLACDEVGLTKAPTERELRVIREELDPHGWYTQAVQMVCGCCRTTRSIILAIPQSGTGFCKAKEERDG